MNQVAAVPQIITDLTTIIAFIAAVIALAVAIRKIRWLRRLYNYLFTEPLGRWFRTEVAEANKPLADTVESFQNQFAAHRNEFEQHRAYVAYHLGPNGETPAVHTRIGNLEEIIVVQLPPHSPPEH